MSRKCIADRTAFKAPSSEGSPDASSPDVLPEFEEEPKNLFKLIHTDFGDGNWSH
ncbi:hypothetical protein [Candidatus Williamhamiltonella defendens]|uniref:hypothetical protein n=1 Tax=Candidatus Williamhamiltonella defendens TaxID=138072 RepID=UPI0016518CC3|nr:hypothetical protein [Candidatus Hamiltonella defensa]